MLFQIRDGKLVSNFLEKTSTDFHPISSLTIPKPPLLQMNYPYSKELQHFLAGRQLLLDEIPYSFSLLYEHYENGYIQFQKGIERKNNRLKCNRCGNSEEVFFAQFPCARCHQQCLYCRHCIMMGRVTQCTPLVIWTGPEPTGKTEGKLNWSGQLSIPQQEASEKIIKAIAENDSLLVWAVCGAGKTEMLFQGIEYALNHQKRIAIATPRTDVVLELTPRLKKVFPNIKIAALYGGSEDRHIFSPLVITTTHQLFRFYKAFDVMIIDEVDAFPYSVDESLRYAAEKARKETSSQVYLTATPEAKWQKQCKARKLNHVIIPARFHRKPVPIPRFEWCGNWKKQFEKNYVPGNIRQWVKKRVEIRKQALLFFSKIEIMENVLPIFRQIHPNIESVHAEDEKRKEKVEAMRKGEILILLTTTILERGVTIPNIDVAVIGAEDDIFTESALVQISGRVGRSSDYPSGDIVFFHYGKTKAMIAARNQLIRMNEIARKKGLLDV